MMFQSHALFPHLDLIDNVAFSFKMVGVGKETRRATAVDMLKLMQMNAYATHRQLSYPVGSSTVWRWLGL